jgi:hypothetical protein
MGEGKKNYLINLYIAFYDAAITFKKGGRVRLTNLEGVAGACRDLKAPERD